MFELQINSEGESDICSKEHHLSSSENWTHDLCDTGAVLYWGKLIESWSFCCFFHA